VLALLNLSSLREYRVTRVIDNAANALTSAVLYFEVKKEKIISSEVRRQFFLPGFSLISLVSRVVF